MGYAEKRGSGAGAYYLARFSDGHGKWPTVKNATGATVRYKRKRDADKAANDEEAKVRGGTWKDTSAGQITFGEFAGRWYAAQELAASTMQNYRRHLEEHLLPEFENTALADILGADVDGWERKEAAAGYKPSSIKTWRGTLHLLLADAVEEELIQANPATKRRGRGKRAGRSKRRGPEKVTVDALGALLIAERAALLAGRDDEFVAVILKFFTGMRWAEIVGLEKTYARPGSIRVEWQLYELDTGELDRCPPKDDSYRDVDLPAWLSALVADHIARTSPKPCACHNLTYVFRGRGTALAARPSAVRIADVAKAAGVSTGTVSNVLNRPDQVAEATRVRVEKAVAELGFVRGASGPQQGAAHWRRSSFATWTFQPAATGWYPAKAPQKARPVPVTADPWPGTPVRGKNAAARAETSWLPIARGLTPHGMRHSHKTLMAELRTPEVLSHERMGHELEGIGGRYSHVTPGMRAELCDELTKRWLAALDARAAMHPHSPVAALDELLSARQGKKKVGRSDDRPTDFPQRDVSVLRAKPRKGA